MAIAGGNIWAFKCKVVESGGTQYLVTGDRSYYPKDKVLQPEEAVMSLKDNPEQPVWVPLLGLNSQEIIKLWDNREK